jgi:hypothetical protein
MVEYKKSISIKRYNNIFCMTQPLLLPLFSPFLSSPSKPRHWEKREHEHITKLTENSSTLIVVCVSGKRLENFLGLAVEPNVEEYRERKSFEVISIQVFG